VKISRLRWPDKAILGRGRTDQQEVHNFRQHRMFQLSLCHSGRTQIAHNFDPARDAILLVGGNKTGDKRWYKKHIRIAEERFERHLRRLEEEE